jgi:hypothetical protein
MDVSINVTFIHAFRLNFLEKLLLSPLMFDG